VAQIVAGTPGMPPAPAAIPLGGAAPGPVASAAPPSVRRPLPRPWVYTFVAAGIVVFLGLTAAGGMFVLRAASSRPLAQASATPPVVLATTTAPPTGKVPAPATAPVVTTVRPPTAPDRSPLPDDSRADIKPSAVTTQRQAWLNRTLLGDYERIGRKGERWEADAREILRLTAESWTNRYRDLATINTIHKRAELAGCKEPVVGYAASRLWGNQGWRQDLTAERMQNSGYHPMHRCLAQIRASHYFGANGNGEEARHQALKLIPEATADREVPVSIVLEMCELLEESFMRVQKDRKIGFDKIEAELAKSRPESSILYTYRGSFNTRYAWDARGGGYANTVTEDGWRLFGQRLQAAKAALDKAWQLDPANSEAPRAMLSVELGQGRAREDMELWFKRAMTADPDNYDACKAKLYYLEPKWHGSPAAMLEFGRECLKTGNYKARLPLVLADAHEAISVYQDNADAYFTQPGVWKDIQAAYEPYLKAFPKASFDRSKYVFLACRAQQWEAAHQQFGLLGEDVQLNVFGGRERYDQLRQEAARWAQLPPKR